MLDKKSQNHALNSFQDKTIQSILIILNVIHAFFKVLPVFRIVVFVKKLKQSAGHVTKIIEPFHAEKLVAWSSRYTLLKQFMKCRKILEKEMVIFFHIIAIPVVFERISQFMKRQMYHPVPVISGAPFSQSTVTVTVPSLLFLPLKQVAFNRNSTPSFCRVSKMLWLISSSSRAIICSLRSMIVTLLPKRLNICPNSSPI